MTRDTAGCVGKLAYATRSAADRVKANLMGKKNYKSGGGLHAYCCPLCSKFHLGRDRRAGPTPTAQTERRKQDGTSKLHRYLELTGGRR